MNQFKKKKDKKSSIYFTPTKWTIWSKRLLQRWLCRLFNLRKIDEKKLHEKKLHIP